MINVCPDKISKNIFYKVLFGALIMPSDLERNTALQHIGVFRENQ